MRSLFGNKEGGWEEFDDEFVIVVVTDDSVWVEGVFPIESLLLLIDVCLDTCFVCGERIVCCLDVELLLVVVVADGRVFCDTIVEYCRTGGVVVVVVDDDDSG